MRHYPMFVSLENRACLVVGAGEVGVRKIETLLECGAREVLAVDPAPQGQGLEALAGRPGFVLARREFSPDDLDGRFLVIAATGNAGVNSRIGELCRERGILCNLVDQPEDGSFIVPATLCRGDLLLAVSTAGQSPALARRVRRELAAAFGQEYGHLLALLGRLRPLVLALGQPTAHNTAIFRSVAHSPLLDALKTGDSGLARTVLAECLPEMLHAKIPELLHGLV